MLVTSIFSFCYSVFQSLLLQGRLRSKLCGKELRTTEEYTADSQGVYLTKADPEGGTGGPDPPWNFGKKVVIRFVIGTGLILHSIYVNYSHKSKKGSKCGDLMVRT